MQTEIRWVEDPKNAYVDYSDAATVMKENLAARGINTELEELGETGKWVLRTID